MASPAEVELGTSVRVTVVIATRNRCQALTCTLDKLAALRPPPPVIVVDNGSADGTVQAVRRRFPAVQVLALCRNLGAAARNLGVQATRTPYVAFCDDDSWWPPGRWSGRSRHWTGIPAWPWWRPGRWSAPGSGPTRSRR